MSSAAEKLNSDTENATCYSGERQGVGGGEEKAEEEPARTQNWQGKCWVQTAEKAANKTARKR